MTQHKKKNGAQHGGKCYDQPQLCCCLLLSKSQMESSQACSCLHTTIYTFVSAFTFKESLLILSRLFCTAERLCQQQQHPQGPSTACLQTLPQCQPNATWESTLLRKPLLQQPANAASCWAKVHAAECMQQTFLHPPAQPARFLQLLRPPVLTPLSIACMELQDSRMRPQHSPAQPAWTCRAMPARPAAGKAPACCQNVSLSKQHCHLPPTGAL